MSDPYSDWASLTLTGISAPVNATNSDTLWAWSGQESGSDRMRWNNPLNTTQIMNGTNRPVNDVGVQLYPTVAIGIQATVITLLNGHYPTIVANLRNSVPRAEWGNACVELGVWGTGCGWIHSDFGQAPELGGSDLTPEQDTMLRGIYDSIGNGAGDTIFALLKGSIIQSLGDGKGATVFGLLEQIQASAGSGGGLTAAQAQQLTDIENLCKDIRSKFA